MTSALLQDMKPVEMSIKSCVEKVGTNRGHIDISYDVAEVNDNNGESEENYDV